MIMFSPKVLAVLAMACIVTGAWPLRAREPETTYSDGWERDDPITIASFEEGECCCPLLRRLPGGDLVVGVGRGGDIHFANNAGDHAAWFRSHENGRTWAPDREFRPPYEKLFIRDEVVRCYDQYSFAIKGRSPSRYIRRYAESTDGGRTFAKRGISREPEHLPGRAAEDQFDVAVVHVQRAAGLLERKDVFDGHERGRGERLRLPVDLRLVGPEEAVTDRDAPAANGTDGMVEAEEEPRGAELAEDRLVGRQLVADCRWMECQISSEAPFHYLTTYWHGRKAGWWD